MIIIGAVVFFIGVILTALSLTAAPSSNLLLAGLVIAGGGFVVMWLFKKS
jgi:hypothetical protein